MYTSLMKKLPAWTHHFIAPLIITMLMSAIVSGVATWNAVGFAGLRAVWLYSWLWSWLVAYPALLVVMPIARKLMTYIVESRQRSS